MINTRQTGLLGQLERDRRSMMLMERALFPVFLMIALAGRVFLLPRRGADVERRKSVLTEASDLTHSVVPWFYVLR